ncbi:bacterioferritin-associated ferredoxin [Psychrobacter sp. FDAARGOS_221]|uniref:(2Fe-2S)-binding protein n=1 Tax=Psychrobacter sp. FDAARGOS_221 TaxID=1975705 RepID=UPI000BB59BC5|nr:(2Fe-2S)-binding protein [Psychrobacter sp. FDAARGOS_221]PNK61045.1 (2Fe-2S)-binding protein [Psychrobacter sp. FDAARGOS_221]
MIVCICNNVKDRQIKAAIASGVDSMGALQQTLDVATCCGCCEPMVNDYLEEHQANAVSVDELAYAV